MKYGFLHTAAVSPALHVADCAYNTQQIIAAMRAQAVAGTKLLCLPEVPADDSSPVPVGQAWLYLMLCNLCSICCCGGRGGFYIC